MTLDNGLRVVVWPRPGCRVISVAVAYRAGFRDEQPGQSGFAHLFEHLMTQGSPSLDKLEHKTRVEAAGGWYSGSTRADCTPYVSTLPAGALEMALACESDRMRGLRLTQDNLDNQVSVVEQEIRGNISSQPFGGFPCFHADAVLFSLFENAHDGYGELTDLRAATLSDAAAFHARYYVPGAAVVAVSGDIDPDEVVELTHRWFDDVPTAPAPPPRDVDEPPPPAEVRAHVPDPLATVPALAIGYRLPDPIADWPGYVRGRLLADVLTRRLRRTLAGPSVVAAVGSLGDWTASAGPVQLTLGIGPLTDRTTEQCLRQVDDLLERTAADLGDDEVRRCAALLTSGYRRAQEQVYVASQTAATLELLHGDASRATEPPDLWLGTDARQLTGLLERHVLPRQRAIVEVGPA